MAYENQFLYSTSYTNKGDYMNIVPTNVNYNYLLMTRNLTTLIKKYPFINIQSIGNSPLNKKLYSIRLGIGKKEVFYAGSFHANEWITSLLLMKFIEDYCNSYIEDSKLYGISIKELYENVSIYIVPMVNPDGVDLVTNSLSIKSSIYRKALNIAHNYPDIPFPQRMESKY